jgi:DNA-binding transcriptional LysR family regulator
MSRRIGVTREVLVASPAYLRKHGTPGHIQDLKSHRCLAVGNARRRQVFWRFDGPDGPLEVAVTCGTTSNTLLALILAACMDDGIIRVPEILVSGELAQGLLKRVLPEQCDKRPLGVYAVCPNLKPPAKIRAFIDFVEEQLPLLEMLDRWSPLSPVHQIPSRAKADAIVRPLPRRVNS